MKTKKISFEDHDILEFYHHGRKVAECEAGEVLGLGKDAQDKFWSLQDSLDRAVTVSQRLRIHFGPALTGPKREVK